jgi:SAM-dependent methyltransferase
MTIPEDSYGNLKRLVFITEAVRQCQPANILDVGCGTGSLLTRPLAETFPEISVTGSDSDTASIAFANGQGRLQNLAFILDQELDPAPTFDMVIASEVIEHVEDPSAFTRSLTRRLNPGGRLILTLPNGFGPSEISSLLFGLLSASGLLGWLRRIKRRLQNRPAPKPVMADTVAISPHINFFSFRRITSLFDRAGLHVDRYRPRTFLCGNGFDQLLRSPQSLEWNASVADCLPTWMVSDWMFVLSVSAEAAPTKPYRRRRHEKLRRRLNEAVSRHSSSAGNGART